MRPFFWVSGIFFTASTLPLEARDLLLYNPVLHATELTRAGWFTRYEANFTNFSYAASWALALVLAGLVLERVVRRRIQVT